MGCYASRPNTTTLFTKTPQDPPSVLVRAISLTTPLVHHPPLRKGDTHHLVSLTSTTYCSLNQLPQVDDDSPLHVDKEDSLSPDSVINAWELMDGLDDDDDDCDFHLQGKPSSFVNTKGLDVPLKEFDDYKPTKPLWKHLSEESLLSKLDPNVVSTYRRALSSRQLGSNESTENKIVLYFTSLRGIRKTYEDCCCVRMIFRGLRVAVDERDISMDSLYRNELQRLLRGKLICLPQVFIRGKHVGGIEEIKELNESGELGKLLEGFPIRDLRMVCEGCGDARFVPCTNCNGSKKVFEEDEGSLKRCPDCNENGLIRCSVCCS